MVELLPRPAAHYRYQAVVLGGSAGAFRVFSDIIGSLPADFNLPLLLVQHLHPNDQGLFTRNLASVTSLRVIEASDKERIEPGRVYAAPADYHLLVERTGTIALSTDERVNWSRPSIDVLFESAARVWGEQLIAVILSGASSDGTAGIKAVKAAGGLTLAQDPATAEYPLMPQAAIDSGAVDRVLTAAAIGGVIIAAGSGACRCPRGERT